jgi:hypothetical protein
MAVPADHLVLRRVRVLVEPIDAERATRRAGRTTVSGAERLFAFRQTGLGAPRRGLRLLRLGVGTLATPAPPAGLLVRQPEG